MLAGSGAVILTATPRFGTAVRRAAVLAGLAAGWLVLTPPLLGFAPFGKRMWTPAFVSLNAAGALGMLAALTLLFDTPVSNSAIQRTRQAFSWPFVAVGRNALLSWTSLFIMDHALDVTRAGDRSLEAALVGTLGNYGYTITMLTAWVAVCCVMHVARWHVRL